LFQSECRKNYLSKIEKTRGQGLPVFSIFERLFFSELHSWRTTTDCGSTLKGWYFHKQPVEKILLVKWVGERNKSGLPYVS